MFFLGNSNRFDNRRKRHRSPAFVVPKRHLYIIGSSGVGKSNLLLTLLHNTIKEGFGTAFIDPHGETAEQLLHHIPKWRQKDVIYFNPSDTEYPLGLNIVRDPEAAVDALHSIWFNEWGTLIDSFADAACSALSEFPSGTILCVNRLLTDTSYRHRVLSHVTNMGVHNYWDKQFLTIPDRERRDRIQSTLNKIQKLINSPILRNSLGQPKSSFEIKDNTILICNLSQGKLGIRKSSLLASLLLAHLHSFALKRKYRTPFPIVLDEFQLYGSITLCDMLSGVRKFGVPLVMANQSLTQLSKEVRSAIRANAFTTMVFRTGQEDADILKLDSATLPPHVALVEGTIVRVPLFQAKARSPNPIIRRCRALSPGREVVEARLRRFLA